MRVIHYDPQNRTESTAYSELLARIDTWWETFEKDKEKILASLHREVDVSYNKWLADWMERNFQAIHPALMYEFAIHGKGHRLVITPEMNTHLRPLVDLLFQRRPTLDGWEFYAYRPLESVEMARLTVEGRTRGNIEGCLVSAAMGQFRRINLTFFSPHYSKLNERELQTASFIATESLLGEEWLDKWCGAIETVPFTQASLLNELYGAQNTGMVGKVGGRLLPPRPFPLDRLAPTCDALIASNRERLPNRPYADIVRDSSRSHTVLEISFDDPNGKVPWGDMYTVVTSDVPLWEATHSGIPFYSCRFSRFNETFAFLKIEGLYDSEVRGEIEDAINEALTSSNLGGVIGGGAGSSFSYIDLALTDVRKAAVAMFAKLRERKLPRRTWLLFFDQHLLAEWIGLYSETPPPPHIANE
ncbi:MAG: hypothetical protein FWD61_03660 [Phycisphaerales bacterium]|nr:hypothetical protein [Phycisphaerales bacterium]